MIASDQVIGEQAGYLWTWWKGDSLPALPPIKNWQVRMCDDITILKPLMILPAANIQAMLDARHRCYVAYLDETAVAYGWSAIAHAAFGPGVRFFVPEGNRYLYCFTTRPQWRGRGFYPHLLQEIIQRESIVSDRFWIIHQLANSASRKGIDRAGFQMACSVYELQAGGLALLPGSDQGRAEAGALLLSLPLLLPEK